MTNRLGPDAAVRQMSVLLSYQGTALDFSTIHCPTPVVCVELDTRTPRSHHEEMASRSPHATLCVVDGSAHFTLLVSPAVVDQAMKGWILVAINFTKVKNVWHILEPERASLFVIDRSEGSFAWPQSRRQCLHLEIEVSWWKAVRTFTTLSMSTMSEHLQVRSAASAGTIVAQSS